jgi:beta-glucosidase/6-phospho-beta-glucosidase/beta-galactosidase
VTNSTEDIAAANRARDFALGWFAEPIFFGDYPKSMKEGIASRSALEGYTTTRLPEFTKEEKRWLKGISRIVGLYNSWFQVPPTGSVSTITMASASVIE